MAAQQVFSAIVLIFCSVLNTTALCHTIYEFFLSKPSKSATIPKLTKCIVLLSMLLMSSDTFVHSAFQIIMHSSYNPSDAGCQIYVIIISISYYCGKSFLYLYYILRAAGAFKGTSMEYTQKQLIVFSIIIIMQGIISGIGWPTFQLPFTKVATDQNGYYYCIVTATVEQDYTYHHVLTYFLIYATISETCVAIWTVWLFIGNLFKMSYNTFQMRKKSFSTDQVGKSMKNIMELDCDNADHVQIWYKYTKKVNGILLIVTKLLILLLISIFTSYIALIFYLTIFSRVYGVDCCINVYCMYLSFSFTDRIWSKLFCRKQCVSCSFPWIKTWAFTCFIKCKRQKLVDTQNNEYQKCVCQCQVPIYNNTQRRLRKMVKNEYDLFIKQNKE